MSPIIPRPRGDFPRRAAVASVLGPGEANYRCAEHGPRDPSSQIKVMPTGEPTCADCGAKIVFDIGPRTMVFFAVCPECGESVVKSAPTKIKPTFRELHRRECPAAITCPVCDKTSYHPKDIEHGYCGYCHADTSKPRKVTHGRGKRLD